MDAMTLDEAKPRGAGIEADRHEPVSIGDGRAAAETAASNTAALELELDDPTSCRGRAAPKSRWRHADRDERACR